MIVEGFPAEMAGTNCYVVAPGPGERCLVVDPGVGVGPRLADVLERHRLRPAAVLLTHGHLDHTASVFPVCEDAGVPAWIHPDDRGQLADPWWGLGLPYGAPIAGIEGLTFSEPADVRTFADGDRLDLAGLLVGVRSAPGHTVGSVVFDLDDEQEGPSVFAGDVLFAGSIGRTDLPGGSDVAMRTTLERVILPMADETVVRPGHGPVTTIGRERVTNPFLRGLVTSMGTP